MTLAETGEFGFIEKIRPGCLHRPQGVAVGIGDDAAAFRTAPDTLTLVTTDLLIEGVHFLRATIRGEDLGHKALAVNLSDIAAMGGTPREAFVSLAIPADTELAYLEEIYTGMGELAARHAVNILGGDTTRSPRDLVINLTLTGQVESDQLLRRDGARPGDRIVVTGYLGDSRAGLHLLQTGAASDDPADRHLLRAHCRPRPHLEEGRFLAASGAVTAAMDISDGLSGDLAHLLSRSGVGATILADRLPLSAALRRFCRRRGSDPMACALAGGEDYVLLCTLAPDRADALLTDYRQRFGAELAVIGEITAAAGQAELLSGDERQPLSPAGWDHFQKAAHTAC